MRENRTYGSEGGEGRNPSRPLSNKKQRGSGPLLRRQHVEGDGAAEALGVAHVVEEAEGRHPARALESGLLQEGAGKLGGESQPVKRSGDDWSPYISTISEKRSLRGIEGFTIRLQSSSKSGTARRSVPPGFSTR